MLIFIEAPHNWQDRETIKVKNYGIQRIISNLRNNGYQDEIKCYDFSFENVQQERIQEVVDRLPLCDIYAFSVMETNYLNSLIIADKLKQRSKCTIIFGGSSATEMNREILDVHPQVDYVIYGVNEGAFFDLLSKRPEEVPNLIWRRANVVIKNPLVYPFSEWKKIMPIDVKWESLGEYSQDKFIVLASLGCIANCEFCNIVVKEPKLHEREMKYIIEEIKQDVSIAKSKGVDKIFIQIMHQNFTHRLKELMLDLERENLLDNIHTIAFNSRADTLIIENNKKNLIECIKKYPNILFTVYSGIETYSQKTMDEIGKQMNVNKNVEATKFFIETKRRYSNFSYLLSFIGLSFNTDETQIRENILQIKNLFYNEAYPVHYLFYSPLRLGVKLATKYNVKREKGYYLPINFMKPTSEGNFAYPKDVNMQSLLQRYYYLVSQLPNFTLRKRLYQDLEERNMLEDNNGKSNDEFFKFIHAEIVILENLIDGRDPYEEIREVKTKFNTLLHKLQSELVKT